MPTYTGTAYRALGLQGQDLINFINKYAQEGTEVAFDEFLSAGSTKEGAFFNKPEKNVRIIMEVNNAPDISSFADGIKFRGYQPKELLLNTGSKFRVTKTTVTNGVYEIRMTQL